MDGRNERFERYFDAEGPWRHEMKALRQVVLSCGLREELKWRKPCYLHQGTNLMMIGVFRDYCCLSFFNGSLMPDPDKLMVSPGPNSRAVKMIKFTDVDEIMGREKVLVKYIRASMKILESGAKVDFSMNKSVKAPDELLAALEKNAKLKKAWDGLTPGRRRSWVLFIEGAKQSKTRAERVAKIAPKILKGLGFHDEYKSGVKAAKKARLSGK